MSKNNLRHSIFHFPCLVYILKAYQVAADKETWYVLWVKYLLHAKVLLTLSDFHKGMCWQLDIYFTIFKRKIFSFKLSTISHSPKNLIYNPRKAVGMGMEGWGEKRKRRKEHLFNSKLGKPWWNSQTPTLISKLHKMSLISNLHNQPAMVRIHFHCQ